MWEPASEIARGLEQSFGAVTGVPLSDLTFISSGQGGSFVVVQSHPGHEWVCPAKGCGQDKGIHILSDCLCI